MRLLWRLAWVNLVALAVNALFFLLAILHTCPIVLPILLFVSCLCVLVCLSAKVQGKRLWRRR